MIWGTTAPSADGPIEWLFWAPFVEMVLRIVAAAAIAAAVTVILVAVVSGVVSYFRRSDGVPY